MENIEQTKSKPKPKIQKIKFFELIQKNFAAIGIDPNLIDQSHPFNEKISLSFLIITLSLTCNLMYTICEAKTFAEYTKSIFMCSITAIIFVDSVILLLNVTQLFNLIEGLENFANTRECQC